MAGYLAEGPSWMYPGRFNLYLDRNSLVEKADAIYRPAYDAHSSSTTSLSSHQPRNGSRTTNGGALRSSAADIWMTELRARSRSISNMNHLSGSGIDPFSAAPMPTTKNVQFLLKYYCVLITTGSNVNKTEVLPPHLQPVRRYTCVRDASLRAIMTEKEEFTALMVIMLSRMVHLSRNAPGRSSSARILPAARRRCSPRKDA